MKDLAPESEEEYQAFIRTLKRTDGFRLLFVRSSPAESEDLIIRVKEDLPEKRIEVLRFDEPIDNLYEIVKDLPNREQINILFVQGLEYSLYEYEKLKFGENSERFSYSWKGVPPILNHLNLHRERFRDTFSICFVFLLRSFSLKYFIHRAPDFFDWRSSVFEFPTKPEVLAQESSRILEEGDYEKYCSLNREGQIQRILEIQELLQKKHQNLDYKAELFREQGIVIAATEEYEAALKSFEKAIEMKAYDYEAWYNRGIALSLLGRSEEAIASYDKALEIKPDNYEAWYNRGIALSHLGKFKEAIVSYDKATEIKPDYYQPWYNKGYALYKLGRLGQAIASYDKAIEIKPDYQLAWNNRGIALQELGKLEEAIASYDKALEIKLDGCRAWYNKACCYALQKNIDLAIKNLQQAINLNPEYQEMAKTDNDLDPIRDSEEFQRLINS